jgi:hypothetical protein
MPTTSVSDSYITTVEEADTYFSKRFGASAWTSASSANKTIALQMATRALDAMTWAGFKQSSSQARAFPRKYQLDPDGVNPWGAVPSIDSYGYYPVTTPQAVLDACCEEALALITFYANTAGQAREDLIEAGVKSYTLGDLSETFATPAYSRRTLRSKEAFTLVASLLGKNTRMV